MNAKTMNNRALARAVAEAVQTVGGYVYSGCEVHGDVMLLQEVWSCDGNYTPTQGDIAANKQRLLNAPTGARVIFSTRCQNDEREEEIWEKIGQCRWERVSHWVETLRGEEWEHIEL